jgi:predicted AAA+ superfamily ATPase
VLTGARQVGKSTLLANEEPFRDWRYVSLDDYDALDQAHRDPSALWAGTDRIVLDEVPASKWTSSSSTEGVCCRSR